MVFKISVHWNTKEEGTSSGEFKTVKHDLPYCRCPDGFRCSSEWTLPPKRDTANRKARARLAKRQAAFDRMVADRGGSQSIREMSTQKKPGSYKK